MLKQETKYVCLRPVGFHSDAAGRCIALRHLARKLGHHGGGPASRSGRASRHGPSGLRRDTTGSSTTGSVGCSALDAAARAPIWNAPSTDDFALWAAALGRKSPEYASRIWLCLRMLNNILTQFHQLRRIDVEQGRVALPSIEEISRAAAKLQSLVGRRTPPAVKNGPPNFHRRSRSRWLR